MTNNIMSFKEYFKYMNRLKKLTSHRRVLLDKLEQIQTDAEIRNLELKTFDYTYGIERFLNDSEKEYLKLKYINKYSSSTLEAIHHKSISTLYRYEERMLNKLEVR